ncbi:hypothetical protein GCM10017608_11330 [Agromyces luteolus]|uniref:DUF11 domain-containing protein n=1 Tax=Agromyces luteolus TaxID=88373 RepID=A0A7C9I1X4_9MICO|nr:DUF11 domain-containing protein [Agromyces luteolus]MUN08660.1 DUF11 domain-containing protein [Agromyces luteolus]GLK27200.1 hypothetical protein GCM10017608_11330 [Agromyces luteolus]
MTERVAEQTANSSKKGFLAALAAAVFLSTQILAPGAGAGAATIAADYVAQGPSPITGGQVESVSPDDEVAGAVHTVVAHPDDPDIAWIGTVNGGIWRTNDATSASPHWVPLTDQQASLSIGALELDPTVASNTVLLAGIGRVSSFGRISGPLTGLLRTADAGTSWTPLGGAQLAGESISGVAPRGTTLVVASNSNSNVIGGGQGGIFRSTNGGTSFTRLSGNGTSGLPNVGVFDLVGDPGDPTVLYAGTQQGIFRSLDTGASWTNVTNNLTGISNATTNNLEFAVHDDGPDNVVFAGVVNNNQLAGLWRSTDQGANWTQMDTPSTNEGGVIVGLQPRPKPGGQGGIHFSMAADPTDPQLVYLGGDRQPLDAGPNAGSFPNSIGADDFSGRLFRCDSGNAAGAQCTPLTHVGTSDDSAPHADSREIVFDANGDILEGDDGGVYRQTDPSTTNGEWQSLNGNLQISEHHSCAYDNVGDLILCGDQDTGAPEQSSSGSTSWETLSAGDGGFVAVDDSGAASVRYSSSNSLGAGSFLRRGCTAANVCINSAPGFNVVGQGQTLQAFEVDGAGNSTLPLYTPLVMNDIDPSRFIVTSNRVYESTDALDNLTIIVNSLGAGVGTTRAIAYGGRAGGADNAGVLWFGDSNGGLRLRSSGAGTPATLPGWTNGVANDIVLNPENWADAFVATSTQVFRTTDAGGSFADITGNLGAVSPGAVIRSLAIVPVPGMNVLALFAGTDTGVFMSQTQNLGVWAELGSSLPNTIAFDVTYDAGDDVMLVGTMGRGSWLVEDVSDLIPIADLRVTKTDSPDPVIAGEELFYTITVTNDGPDAAAGAVVVDELPDEVVYLSDDGDCTYDAVEHRLTCQVGDIPAGESREIVVKTRVDSDAVVDEDDGTIRIENVVTVSGASVDDDLTNNSFTQRTFVQERSDLAVTKVCKPDDELPAGDTGTCTIFVDNLGPSSARDIVVTDTNLSDGAFTFGAITPSQGTCGVSGGVVTCQLGDLAAASPSAGGRATVVVEVSATEDVDINDVVRVTSPTPDPDASNNEAQESISVKAVTDLSVDKTGPPTAIAGTEITYTLSIANGGPSTATGVVVTDAVSSGVTIVSVTGSNGASCNAGVPGDAAQPSRCSFGNLAPSATRTMTVVVRILPGFTGELHDDARVESQTFDDDLIDNLDTVTTVVSASADLSITKTDSPDPVLAGDDLTYTITVANGGPSTATDVVVTDELPDGTTFVEGVDGNGTTVCTLVQAGTVVCDLGTMAPGETRTVYLTVTVDPSLDPDAVLENTATVESATPDPDGSDNTANQSTNVDTAADLWLDKTAVLRSGNPAPVIVFTLVVHNDLGCEQDAQSTPSPNCGTGGPSDARDVVVTDELPLTAKKLVVQYISPQCSYDKAAHTVTCSASEVPAGATVSFVIEAQANGSVGTVLNDADVTSSTSDPNGSNNGNAASLVVKGGTGKGKGGNG